MKRKTGGVLHVITALGPGGAELMLAQLIEQTRNSSPTAMVIGLRENGAVGDQIRDSGVEVVGLEMHKHTIVQSTARLSKLIREVKPDVVQTWMYHANLLGGIAAKGAGSPPLAWGIHHADLSPANAKRATRLVAKTGALLSRSVPDAVVICADSARVMHQRLGYAKDKLIVIPNGFDITRFSPDPEAPRRLRERIGVTANTRLAGLVARYHPIKDHQNFVQAGAIAARANPDLHFVMCGTNVDWDNAELTGWIDATGFRDRFHLLGMDPQPWNVHAGLDVGCLSSTSEAFPLSVGESMACGVPCAVTDVGDAEMMVRGTGRTAPPRDPEALAQAIGELLALEPAARKQAGADARRKIETEFSLPAVAHRYEAVWRRIASQPREGRAA